jgi:hypothetical protein
MESEGDTLGFKRAIGKVSDCCGALYCYVSWSAGVVKTLLTKTTLASKFNGFTTDGNGALLFYFGILLCAQIYYPLMWPGWWG